MELKNVTSFDNFKRIYEEKSIPDEFSNTTGFRQSLVGRAMFGIIRYFQKGINLGRLEFYKRKLENEYFAGLLRFCAVKDIDLLTGAEPTGTTTATAPAGSGAPPDPNEAEYCSVLAVDYTDPGYKNKLNSQATLFSGHTVTLNMILADPNAPADDKQEAQEMLDLAINVVNCCREKSKINDVFYALSGLTSASNDTQKVTGYLDQIKSFLESNIAQLCSTYKGTDAEKILLQSFEHSPEATIKDKVTNEILPLLDSYNYFEYDLIEEKITSNINKMVSVTQMLGDQLTEPGAPPLKVNIWEWLKSKGVDDVNKINFTALEKLFSSKGQEYITQCSLYVNKDGIRKIQYAASRIIFHVKKTNDAVGINPGEGGKVNYEEDTSLKTSWEKRVEFCKSEFKNFLDYSTNPQTSCDPFILLNYTDALRKRSEYDRNPQVMSNAAATTALANSITLTTKAQQLGIKPLGNSNVVNEKRLIVFTMRYGSALTYPVFSLKNTTQGKIYRYIGCINFTKILNDKEYDKPDYKNNAHTFTTAIWDRPKTNSDTAFIDILKLRNTPIVEGGYKFEGIYLTKSDYFRIGSYKDQEQNWNVRLLYLFVANGQIPDDFRSTSPTANDFKLKNLYSDALADVTPLSTVKTATKSKMMSVSFGEAYEIEQAWYDTYFNTGNVSKYKDNPYIGDTPFSNVINLTS